MLTQVSDPIIVGENAHFIATNEEFVWKVIVTPEALGALTHDRTTPISSATLYGEVLTRIGASSVVRQGLRRGCPKGSWIGQMLARKPPMLVIFALANKMARTVWAWMARGVGQQIFVKLKLVLDQLLFKCRGHGNEAEGQMRNDDCIPGGGRDRKQARLSFVKLVSSATRIRAFV